MPESPDLAAAKRLINAAKRQGFAFHRIAPGEDGPLWGLRQSMNWVDEIYLGAFPERMRREDPTGRQDYLDELAEVTSGEPDTAAAQEWPEYNR